MNHPNAFFRSFHIAAVAAIAFGAWAPAVAAPPASNDTAPATIILPDLNPSGHEYGPGHQLSVC